MQRINSPRTDDEGIEQLIKAKGKVAPRVTPQDIEDNIIGEYYFTASQGLAGSQYRIHDANDNGPLALLTFCVLTLRNGYTVHGSSACASPENFDAQIGKTIARQNAVQEIWPLMGYALKEQLSQN